jgi:YbdK family carboxylate-amine ligase
VTITFNSSPEPTLGVELELQVIDQGTLDHVPAASEILAELGNPYRIKHELFESTVEINTDICHTVKEARADLQEKLDTLHEVCDRRGWALLSSGTHPFADWVTQVISPDPRYHRLVEGIQWPARQLLIFGIHFHVGVDGPEKAIAMQNSVATYIPHFLALSASSPFWGGFDTGLASARTKVFEVMPTAGLPYRMDNWHEFLHFMDALRSARTIQTVREVWTDIRPHPGFGTVELRICDATPTLAELSSLAAMAQAMVVWLDRRYESGRRLPLARPWIVRENKWRAARFGLAADLIVDNEGSLKPLLRSIRELVEDLSPIARELDCQEELGDVERIIAHGPSYLRQRRVWERTGDLMEVVRSLADELRTGQVGG